MHENGADVGTSHTFSAIPINRSEDPLQKIVIAQVQHTHKNEHPVTEERALGEMDTVRHDIFMPAVEPTLPGEKETTVADKNINERTSMSLSPAGCCNGHATPKNARDVTATPAGLSEE